MPNRQMTHKLKVILASLSVLVLSIVLTACGSSSKEYDENQPVAKQVNKHINGIEAGAGQMTSTRNALKDYGLDKEGWQLQSSSTAAMLSQLDKAYQRKQPIVATVWQPHWAFKKYDLKFLDDPKKDYGDAEHISSIANKNFSKQNPGAYKLLQQFKWDNKDISDVMIKTNEGEDPTKAAKDFVNSNSKLVDQWTKDVPKGNGKEVRLTNVAWDSEIASTNVIAQAFQKMGYKTSIKTLEPQPMYIALANGSADASVSAWLPVTHSQYLNQYKDKIAVAGDNLEDARTGLVVPKYMTDINSISDLKDK